MIRSGLLFLFLPVLAAGQTTDTTKAWNKGGLLGLNFTQSSYTNWSSGGQNSVSGTILVNLFAKYKTERNVFDTRLDLAYGRVQVGPENRKSEDKIDLAAKYGHLAFGKTWFYSVLFSFKSQFDNGYNYPNDTLITSRFLAPAFLNYGIGLDYKPKDYFSVMIAPLSGKTTLVYDTRLSAAGAFGVDSGKMVRNEFGGSLTLEFSKEISKNIKLTSALKLFSNYLKTPGNIDVNWESLLALKVNKYISATLSAELIYDDDTHIPYDGDGDGVKESNGPMTQFKEVLGIGFSYKF
ncbi:MAG: DUF3078 domain-containing protein [Bacteroidia bacterium]|nr:DUF3078 domain-containing protein [Bacteroidia bacterium]